MIMLKQLDALCREHWTREMVANNWIPIFPVDIMKKNFVLKETTHSSRYSNVACNFRYAKYSLLCVIHRLKGIKSENSETIKMSHDGEGSEGRQKIHVLIELLFSRK